MGQEKFSGGKKGLKWKKKCANNFFRWKSRIFFMFRNFFGLEINFRWETSFGSRNFQVKKRFWVQKVILVEKRIWIKKNFGLRKKIC